MNLNDHSSYHRVSQQFNRHTIHVLLENNALIGKIHHTVRHCFNMFMFTLNHSASFGITSSRIILEQGTLATPSLFKHNNVSEAIFSISIMDLGKMCEIHMFCCRYVHCCKAMDSEMLCFCCLLI